MSHRIYKYYVDNKVQQGSCTHLVHRAGCAKLPDDMRRLYVGHFANHDEAVSLAKKMYSSIKLCTVCCGAGSSDMLPAAQLSEDDKIILVKCGRNHDAHESESLFAQVLALSRIHGIDAILLDYTDSINVPSKEDLSNLAAKLPKRWRMAPLLEPDSHITPPIEFAVSLASERGISAKIHFDREEAVDWLLS